MIPSRVSSFTAQQAMQQLRCLPALKALLLTQQILENAAANEWAVIAESIQEIEEGSFDWAMVVEDEEALVSYTDKERAAYRQGALDFAMFVKNSLQGATEIDWEGLINGLRESSAAEEVVGRVLANVFDSDEDT